MRQVVLYKHKHLKLFLNNWDNSAYIFVLFYRMFTDNCPVTSGDDQTDSDESGEDQTDSDDDNVGDSCGTFNSLFEEFSAGNAQVSILSCVDVSKLYWNLPFLWMPKITTCLLLGIWLVGVFQHTSVQKLFISMAWNFMRDLSQECLVSFTVQFRNQKSRHVDSFRLVETHKAYDHICVPLPKHYLMKWD